MTIEEAVALMIGVKKDVIRNLGKTPMGFRVEIEGQQLGMGAPMPVVSDALLRVGRHAWLINWKSPKDFKAFQLTVPGT